MAIGLLILNDHIFKGVGPGWLTGKASDFAGLYFFPFLLALIISPAVQSTRLLRVVAFGSTAAVFAMMKLLPFVAGLVESVAATMTGMPAGVAVDRTDLIALSVLIPAVSLWRSIEARPPEPRRILAIVAVLLAGAGTAATSYTEPPFVASVWSHEGDIFAFVDDPSAGASTEVGQLFRRVGVGQWEEVSEPEIGVPALVSAPVTSEDWRRLSEPVLFDASCSRSRPSICVGHDVVPPLERSREGGLGWETFDPEFPPDLYASPITAPFFLLRGPVCQPNSPLDPDARVCTRQLSPVRSVFGWRWETLQGDEGVWAPIPAPEDGELHSLTGRCAANDPDVCFRVIEGHHPRRSLLSRDGGASWAEVDDLRELAPADLDLTLIDGARCRENGRCFRVVEGTSGRSQVQESPDGGVSWETSWLSPPLARSISVLAVAVTDDAVVAALQWDGVMSRMGTGEWGYEELGPVPRFDPPGPFEPGPTAIPAIAWLYVVALSVFGLAASSVRGITTRDRAAALLLAAAGVIYTVTILNLASATAPLGFWDGAGQLDEVSNMLVVLGMPFVFLISVGLVDWRNERYKSLLRGLIALGVGAIAGFIVFVAGILG